MTYARARLAVLVASVVVGTIDGLIIHYHGKA